MNTCFNCGTRYHLIGTGNIKHESDGFCSAECEDENDARLVEGNGIIEAAEKAEFGFTDINKLKLDTHMPLAAKALQDLKEKDKQQLNNLLGFNRKQDTNETENDGAL